MKPLLTHLALKFADERAIDVILNECGVQVLDSILWRDTRQLKTVKDVVWEVKYLKMRGRLMHHPLVWHLVRLKGYDEKTK